MIEISTLLFCFLLFFAVMGMIGAYRWLAHPENRASVKRRLEGEIAEWKHYSAKLSNAVREKQAIIDELRHKVRRLERGRGESKGIL